MPCNDFLLIVDQQRDVEPKRLDALSDLANLFVAMTLGFRGSGFRDVVRRYVTSNGTVDGIFLLCSFALKQSSIGKK